MARSHTFVALLEIGALMLWLGAAAFFSMAAAPAAFRVLPSGELPGRLIGELLPVIFVSGVVVGAFVIAAEMMEFRPGRRVRVAAGALLVAACGFAQVIVGREIDRLRASAGRPMAQLAPDDPMRAAFGRWHGVSVAALGGAILAASAGAAAAWRLVSHGSDDGA